MAAGEGRVRWTTLAVAIVGCELAGIVPGLLTAGDVATWYPTLNKPAFTPPGWVFGPVWTFLYALMGVALYLAWQRRDQPGGTIALGLFAVQLVLNAGWTLTFFGARSIVGGLLGILVLWVAIVGTIVSFWRLDHRAGVLLVPYLAWVSFAVALNVAIWQLN